MIIKIRADPPFRLQLRDVGRKYRSMFEDTNKKLEELKKETDSLKGLAERQTAELETAKLASAAAAENSSKAQVRVITSSALMLSWGQSRRSWPTR